MFQPDLLKDKSIVITGGGTGLGYSMAQKFGDLGANICICSRRKNIIEESTKNLKNNGVDTFGLQCDVRNWDQVFEMIEKTNDRFGSIDVLLNNAAGNFISPTERLSANAFRSVVDIVLNGTFNCSMAAMKVMKKKHSGVILNIVTTYAWTGSSYVVPSAAAKAGVLAITRSLSVEWAKYGIRTNAIAPGPFPTKGAWSRLVPSGLNLKKKIKNRIPLKRFGRHEELANLATFLISDGASYINGEVVTIDGGEWLKGAGQFNDLDKIPDIAWKTMDVIRKKKKT